MLKPADPENSVDLAPDFAGDGGDNFTRTLWRHRYLIIGVTLGAMAIGYWLYAQKPTTYSAANQLHVISENPLVLDKQTGTALAGGVPDETVLKSLILSDSIVAVAAQDTELTKLVGDSEQQIARTLRSGLRFESQGGGGRSERLMATLSFSGTNPELCVAAVNATGRAIESYFEAERATSINTLTDLIGQSEGRLLPELQELEEDYQKFRETAGLDWGANGEALNSHRERQMLLRNQQLELANDKRSLETVVKLIETVAKKPSDIAVAVQVIEHLGSGLTDSAPTAPTIESLQSGESRALQQLASQTPGDDMTLRDLELQELEIEKGLVPLIEEQQRMAMSFNSNHPSVKSLNEQVKLRRQMLSQLSSKRASRVAELRKATMDKLAKEVEAAQKGLSEDRAKELLRRQQSFVQTYYDMIRQKIALTEEQIKDLSVAIGEAKAEADKLAQAESNDAMFRRKIDGVQGMLLQLESKMSNLNVSEVNSGIRVEPLYASVSPRVTGPDLKQDLVMFGALGLVLGSAIAMLLEANSRMFRNSDQIARELGVPVLAHVPQDDELNKRKKKMRSRSAIADLAMAVLQEKDSAVSEAIRGLRTSILFHSNRTGHKVFQFTSPLPGDGKSTIAANLAVSLANSGKRTLLIDLDLRSPKLTERFNLLSADGVTNVINGECDPFLAIKPSEVDGLEVLGSGKKPINPAEALLRSEMEALIQWAREHYDYVIVDSPPLLLVTDPAITTAYVDATILVTQVVRKSLPNSKEAMSILKNAGGEVVGVVVNKIDQHQSASYYQIGTDGAYNNVGYGYGGSAYKRKRKKGEEDYIVAGSEAGKRIRPTEWRQSRNEELDPVRLNQARGNVVTEQMKQPQESVN